MKGDERECDKDSVRPSDASKQTKLDSFTHFNAKIQAILSNLIKDEVMF